MGSFHTDPEIAFNAKREEILFDGQMRELDGTCLYCQRNLKCKIKYLPSDSVTRLKHLASTSCGSIYRFVESKTGPSSEVKSAVIVSAISAIVIGRFEKANHCRNVLVSAWCFSSIFFNIRL